MDYIDITVIMLACVYVGGLLVTVISTEFRK